MTGSPVPPRKTLQEAPQRKSPKSYRKVAIGIALLVLVLIGAGILVTNNPGVPGADTNNTTEPGLLGALPFGAMSEKSLFSNQATPVVTDTPLEPK